MVTVRIVEIDIAATMIRVDLTRQPLLRIGPVGDAVPPDARQDLLMCLYSPPSRQHGMSLKGDAAGPAPARRSPARRDSLSITARSRPSSHIRDRIRHGTSETGVLTE